MKIVMDNQQQLLETNKMMVDVVKNSQSNITNHTTNTNSHNTINNWFTCVSFAYYSRV